MYQTDKIQNLNCLMLLSTVFLLHYSIWSINNSFKKYELYNAFKYSIFAPLFYLIHKQIILKDNLTRLITFLAFCQLCFWLPAGEWHGSEMSLDLLQSLLYSEQNYRIPKSTETRTIHLDLRLIHRFLTMYSLWTSICASTVDNLL